MDKTVFNCQTGEVEIIELTVEEIAEREAEAQAAAEQAVLDSLIPTEKEILMAEIEIQTIQILQEGGFL